jgi:hypothetical protein
MPKIATNKWPFLGRVTRFFYKEKMLVTVHWQYGLWSFQTGDTKFERFLSKNQHTQTKLLSFGLMVSCRKVPKFVFPSQFFMSKIIRIFLNFFFH